MNDTPSFRCTCGNHAKNLMTLTTGELLAKCGRCAPIRQNPRPGGITVVPLANVAFTDQMVAKIKADTLQASEAKRKEREQQETRLSKAKQVLTTIASAERNQEMEVALQAFREDELLLPTSFNSREAKWRHMPYDALHLILEFSGDWEPRRVARRWYNCFMYHDVKLVISTGKLVQTIFRCSQTITTTALGWSEEHTSFWGKLLSGHTETITSADAPNIPPAYLQYPDAVKRIFLDGWVLPEIARPCFVTRDKTLLTHLINHFEDRTWIRNGMKLELSRIARLFSSIKRFPLFLKEYGYLMEELGTTPAMIDEMAKLPTDDTQE